MSIQQQLVKARWVFFLLIALLYLVGFNGLWRLSSDSALYRALGESLSHGEGYRYQGQEHSHAYPGLPWLLAWSRMIFQDDVLPVLILNLLLVAASFVCIYFVVKALAPKWVAVGVVIITATNAELNESVANILTDTAFYFSVCLTLLAQVNLQLNRRRANYFWTVVLMLGVGLGAAFRPAFWIVLLTVVSWLILSVSRRSLVNSACLVVGLVAAIGAWLLFDTRSGWRDEGKLLRVIQNPDRMITRVADNVPAFMAEHGMDIVFGVQFAPYLDIFLVLCVLAGCVLLARRYRFGGVFVGLTLLVTLLFAGTVPRYYIMILPLLAWGWIELLRRVAHYLPRKIHSQAIGLGILLVVLPNMAMNVKLVLSQRSYHAEESYHDPEFQDTIDMAEAIKQHVPDDMRAIGPYSRILTFLSKRDVVDVRELLRRREASEWNQLLSQNKVTYVVTPPAVYKHQWPELLEVLRPIQDQVEGEGHPSDQWLLIRVTYAKNEGKMTFDRIVASGPIHSE